MVNGLNTFRSWFTDYQDNYIIIGGTACDAVLTDAGLTPRATKDIDIILIFEALTKEFVSHFWEFVKEAGFRCCEQEIEKRNAYRFLDPADTRFPKQVELFCRMPDALTLPSDLHITPIPVEEGLSSLSAILLNDEYYHFTLNHSYFDDGIHFANIEALICLKAYAFLSNLKLKESGVEIHSVNIEKHKNDVFLLLPLLPQNTTIELGKDMLADMKKFASTIEAQLPDNKMLKDAGYVELTSETLYQNLVSVFQLDKPLP